MNKIDVLNKQQLENIAKNTSIKLEDISYGEWWKEENKYHFKLYLKSGKVVTITSTNDKFLNYL